MTDIVRKRDLAQSWSIALLVWSPIIIYQAGYSNLVIKYIFIEPANMVAEALSRSVDTLFTQPTSSVDPGSEAVTPTATTPETPSEPMRAGDMSPGAVLIIGLIQVALLIFVIAIMFGAVILASATAVVYAIAVIGATVQALHDTYRFAMQYRQEGDDE